MQYIIAEARIGQGNERDDSMGEGEGEVVR